MTTWCRPDTQQQQQQQATRFASKQQRHSIADILGWTATASGEVVKVESVMMASAMDSSEMREMQINDEPLDLSLDKSKCRRQEAAAAAAAAAAQTGIKRAIKTKSVADDQVVVAGALHDEPGDDEEEDGEPEMWPADMMVGQGPHQQQMAASLYMMMQSYLASRLLQNSEAMRYQSESQGGRRGGDGEDASSEDVGDDGGAINDPMAVAAAAAAAVGLLSGHHHHQLPPGAMDSMGSGHPASKRRKKDNHSAAVLANGDDPAMANGGARPRKTRTTFTGKQLFELERIFEQKKYLSSNERQEVARLLNVTGSQVSDSWLLISSRSARGSIFTCGR